VTNGIKYSCQIFKIVSISTKQFEGTTTILLKEKETSFALYYMKESKAKKKAHPQKNFLQEQIPGLCYGSVFHSQNLNGRFKPLKILFI
jgi:hypothetical protein